MQQIVGPVHGNPPAANQWGAIPRIASDIYVGDNNNSNLLYAYGIRLWNDAADCCCPVIEIEMVEIPFGNSERINNATIVKEFGKFISVSRIFISTLDGVFQPTLGGENGNGGKTRAT